LAAGAGGLVRLPKRVSLGVALEMAMTGDPVDAATAHRLGLVNRVVPGDQVLDAAVELVHRICRNAPWRHGCRRRS
jgi:enoyl-CoA hydratase/carnithine racemase